jgi:hypothetical protein
MAADDRPLTGVLDHVEARGGLTTREADRWRHPSSSAEGTRRTPELILSWASGPMRRPPRGHGGSQGGDRIRCQDLPWATGWNWSTATASRARSGSPHQDVVTSSCRSPTVGSLTFPGTPRTPVPANARGSPGAGAAKCGMFFPAGREADRSIYLGTLAWAIQLVLRWSVTAVRIWG